MQPLLPCRVYVCTSLYRRSLQCIIGFTTRTMCKMHTHTLTRSRSFQCKYKLKKFWIESLDMNVPKFSIQYTIIHTFCFFSLFSIKWKTKREKKTFLFIQLESVWARKHLQIRTPKRVRDLSIQIYYLFAQVVSIHIYIILLIIVCWAQFNETETES